MADIGPRISTPPWILRRVRRTRVGRRDRRTRSRRRSPRSSERNPRDVSKTAGIEGGEMNGNAVWEQEAAGEARLIPEGGYARLGDYDNGRDNLRQKIQTEENTELS